MGRYAGEDFPPEHYLRAERDRARETVERLRQQLDHPAVDAVVGLVRREAAWLQEATRIQAKYAVQQGDYGIEYSDRDPVGSTLAYLEAALDEARARLRELAAETEDLRGRLKCAREA